MRVLQIRLKNLNSLVGEWRVDFTHPAYAADGLFAITGPTGAGKSTLLDALCLALFGRTPRLGRISKSSNEIMSRQTGECMAEAVIETPSGRYRCHWSQHRARRRAGGELQMPRHEIAWADDGVLIESSLRGVAEQIEGLTGMDFERFTRSMLLAQGGFAAFLQAAPDERSPLLEQITGTAIYSDISVRVHEQYGAARQALETLQATMAGTLLLTDEDVQALEARRVALSREAEVCGQRVARHAEAVRWLDGLQRLSREHQSLVARQADWQARSTAFAADQQRLDAAARALELASEQATVQALRQAQQDAGVERSSGQAALPGLAATLAHATQALADGEARLAAARAAQRDAQPALQATRALDVRMAGLATSLAAQDAEWARQVDRLAAFETQHRQLSEEARRERDTLQAQQVWAEAHRADERLVAALDALQARFEALAQRQDEAAGLGAQHQRLVIEADEAEAASRVQGEAWSARQQETQARHAALAAAQSDVAEPLAGRTLADVRRGLAERVAQRDGIRQGHDAMLARAEAGAALETLAQRMSSWTQQRTDLAAELAQQTQQQHGLARELELLETQLSLLQRVEDLTAARHQLEDGQPCPLCGALSHPYAAGQMPQPDETRSRLAAVRTALADMTAHRADLQGRQASLAQAQVDAAAQQADWTTRWEAAGQRLVDVAARWPAAQDLVAQAGPAGQWAALLVMLDEDIAGETVRLEAVEAAGQAQALRQAALDAARLAEAQAERAAQAATHRRDELFRRRDHARGQADAAAAQAQAALAVLAESVRPHGIDIQADTALPTVLDELSARRERWLAHQQDMTVREQRQQQQGAALQHLGDRMAQQREAVAALRVAADAQRMQWQSWQAERRALLGERRVEDEEATLAGAVAQAEADVAEQRRRQAVASQAHVQAQTRLEALLQSMAARAARLDVDEPAWLNRVRSAGFDDEAAWRAACLPAAQREALQQQAATLAREQATLSSQQRDHQRVWDAEQARALTESTREVEQAALAQAAQDQQAQHQALGDVEAQLARHRDALQHQQAQRLALAARQADCDRWSDLHALIGSADGKKYRNFAQGLTFERVITHANRQLRRMSDRYLLVRDTVQPLSLNVVDAYQAGEVRSTRNLSGGESFIVSLALALGLAQMVSRHVRVDSLFLDEGFGTLDEEALDTALNTLAGLRQDGKIIGVISHVPALKERIATQIQVVPGAGGVSRLSGPGCERVGA